MHGVPHAARLGALPAALELVELRLPRALPGALGADATPASRSPRSRAATGAAVRTDRGDLTAPADRRRARLAPRPRPGRQRPAARGARSRRGLEVHPHGDGTDLDVWIDRSLSATATPGRCPRGGEQRVGVGSYEPRHHVKEPTQGDRAARSDVDAVRYQGNWFPHRLRPAAEDGVFFVGDSAGHCFPLSGEGIRTAFYFGIAVRRASSAPCSRASRRREHALAAYGALLAPPRARLRAGRSRSSARSRGSRRARSPRCWACWAASAPAAARSTGTWSRRTRRLRHGQRLRR